MGSEMCIRDSFLANAGTPFTVPGHKRNPALSDPLLALDVPHYGCLLYTSDAADERSSVDLGGRRIIKKKNKLDNIQSTSKT